MVSGLDGYAPQAWARVLAELLGAAATHRIFRASVVAAGTERGNEVLAHLGAITGLPMAANCVAAASADAGGLEIVRQRWAGLLLEDAALDATAALLTVATDAVAPEPAPAPGGRRGARDLAVGDATPTWWCGRSESSAGAGGASLATARVVVGGGRGVGSADGFAPLEELAGLLGGVVGVSRVVTSEGWRPHSCRSARPAPRSPPTSTWPAGSAAPSSTSPGCSGAKHIIAINTDPSAPMMTRADYAVVGDLHAVLPALIKALRARAVLSEIIAGCGSSG